MELYTARGISTLPLLSPKLIPLQSPFSSKTHLPVTLTSRTRIGLKYYRNSSLRSTPSKETSTETTPYLEIEPRLDGVVTSEDTRRVEEKEDYDSQSNEVPQEGSLSENPQLLKFLEDFDIKQSLLNSPVLTDYKNYTYMYWLLVTSAPSNSELDYEDTSSILVFGGGGAVALWLAAAVVGAIDSIPLVPNVLELVGLGYTIWFSSRYLLFKKNREELVAKVEQIKQQVLGAKDD